MLWMIVIIGMFVVQTITVLFAQYRHPGKTVAWLMIMIVFPVIGFVLYYFLAQEYKQRRKLKKRSDQMSTETQAFFASLARHAHNAAQLDERTVDDHRRLFSFLGNLSEAPITLRNQTTVYADCTEIYTAMLDAMADAEDHIHMAFYTFRSDRVGRRFQEVLVQKALAGVQVRVMVDGVGSYQINRRFIHEMKQAGIEVYSFLPPLIAFFDKRINFRNHRKIIVVDGKVGFIGGVNIGEEYVGGNERLGYWRDTHLKFAGDAVYYIQHMFISDWRLASAAKILDLPRYYPEHQIKEREAVQIIASGPDKHWDAILEMFFATISSATTSVYLTTPYFIPDSSITMALKTAASSGVDVRIILPHTPDSRLVHWASLSYMEEMMRAGVRCYLYTEGFIHAKVLIIDEVIATVGTANMDMRSFFSNFELNAVLFDPRTVARLLSDFHKDLQHSMMLELQEVENRSTLQRTKEVAARLLSPLL
jgi:cardiolipin synthase